MEGPVVGGQGEQGDEKGPHAEGARPSRRRNQALLQALGHTRVVDDRRTEPDPVVTRRGLRGDGVAGHRPAASRARRPALVFGAPVTWRA
jgi:hypothetical protein